MRTARRFLAIASVVAAGLGLASNPSPSASQQISRTYYIAADEVDWDYAPANINNITGAALQIPSGPQVGRIGKIYRKAIFREYTDATFARIKPRSLDQAYLGLLGPVIRAQVGDTVRIVFKNHTHNRTLIYPQPDVLVNDAPLKPIAPSDTTTYLWRFTDTAGPAPGKPSSKVWMYYSSVDRPAQISAGLVGPIIVTRRGFAKADGAPRDVDREFIAMFALDDENRSPYLDANSRRYTGKPASVHATDPTFYLSNERASINGFSFANMPALTMRAGERVRWYLLSDGSDDFDYHSISWSGATVLVEGNRSVAVPLEQTQTAVADMLPNMAGRRLLFCRDVPHLQMGMAAWYRVLPNSQLASRRQSGVTRSYFIAADEVDWDYAPSKVNQISGEPLKIASGSAVDRIGQVYHKAVYRAYTDATFAHLLPRSSGERYLGFLGPVVRAQVGDTIRVVFKNKTTIPVDIHADALEPIARATSMHAEGLDVPKAVKPGQTKTYAWSVDDQAGPGPNDPSSIVWTYRSDVDEIGDLSAGLLGPIIITRGGQAKADGSPMDADREVITAFSMVDENASPYFDANSRRFTGRPASAQLLVPFTPFYMSNEIPTINGFGFGNLPMPVMRQGERVRWYLIANASDLIDFHSVHWHGNTVLMNGMRTDMVSIDPATTAVADMTPDDPGIWMFHCHVTLHFTDGMVARYRVLPSAQATSKLSGIMRAYYIAADEVDWNYMPSGRNLLTGTPLNFPAGPRVDRIGSTYRKAVYREYTDATFKHLKARPRSELYHGFVGPVMHAEVGDTIRVTFRNNTRFAFTMHPHGVRYDKRSEGAAYQDGTPASMKRGGAVPPGQTFTYVWNVPERAGPGPNDPSSIVWMYHSHVNEVDDLSSGLIGAIVVTRRGQARPNGIPMDVDREVVVVFALDDENTSRFFDFNSRKYTGRPGNTQEHNLFQGFYATNEIASLDGFVFANMPAITLRKGERVRWYMLADASDYADAHVAQWERNVVWSNGDYLGVVPLDPAMTQVVDMIPQHVGTWWLGCDVPTHTSTGMFAVYRVAAQ